MDAHPGQDFPQGVAPEMVAPQAEDQLILQGLGFESRRRNLENKSCLEQRVNRKQYS